MHYPGARWYSFPSESFCGEGDVAPTGDKDCLYSYEYAGAIDVSELAGIGDYGQFALGLAASERVVRFGGALRA